MAEPFAKEREVEEQEEKEPKELPTNTALPVEPKSPLELIRTLTTSIALSKIGFGCFSYFASEYQLEDNHPVLFTVFLVIAFMIDALLALIVIGFVTYLLIGITFGILRAADLSAEANHVIVVIGRQFGLTL